MQDVTVRLARVDDLPAINAIYNHYVERSTCTYQYEPTGLEERLAWFDEHDASHPVTVATRSNGVVGWGSLSWFRTRIGYRFTVENAVYVRHDLHGQGIGGALLSDLVERGRAAGHRAIVAGISAEQSGSIALHLRAGFVEAGRLRQVGFKFDQWLDLILLERLLDDGAAG
jgi:L-amino acid N-acyltransferase